MNLNDVSHFHALDPQDMCAHIDRLPDQLEAAWKHAYSWNSIWRRLRHSPAPWPVRIGTNLGYRFYANNLSRFYNCDWIIGRVPRNAPFVQPVSVAGGETT